MFSRIMSMIRKELIQIRRDRRTLAMMIAIPALWIIAFGYAVTFDVKNIPIAVVDQANNQGSHLLINQFRNLDSGSRFSISDVGAQNEADLRSALKDGRISAGIIVPAGYGTPGTTARVHILVDGSDLFSAQSVLRSAQSIVQSAAMQQVQQMLGAATANGASGSAAIPPTIGAPGVASAPPSALYTPTSTTAVTNTLNSVATPPAVLPGGAVTGTVPNNPGSFPGGIASNLPATLAGATPNIDILYNPDMKSSYVMIPGLIGMVLVFIATLMTALGVVRERERGTMEQLIVTPVRPLELMLGKVLPYVLIAAVDLVIVIALGMLLFNVPLRGDASSIALLAVASVFFLFAALGIGLLVSTVSQNQQQAMQLAVFTLLPQFIFSGFIFPLAAMPWGIRWVGYLLPLTYFIPITRGVFLKAEGWNALGTDVGILAVYGIVVLVLAALRFRKRLA